MLFPPPSFLPLVRTPVASPLSFTCFYPVSPPRSILSSILLLHCKRYGVPYGVSPTPPELLHSWQTPDEAIESSLKLPGPNVFIPDDFSLVCDRENAPEGSAGENELDADSGNQVVATATEGRGIVQEEHKGEGGGGGIRRGWLLWY